MQEKHTFALYMQDLTAVIQHDKKIIVTDKHIMHRIAHVLRLHAEDSCVLFDRKQNIALSITSITKKEINAVMLSKQQNKTFTPIIKLLLPVLKKDALSDAVYNAVELGANAIQLVHTDKAQRTVSRAELERLERVAIAAAEQSKNFAFPTITPPVPLREVMGALDGNKLFFDPAGSAINKALEQLKASNGMSINMLVGPEGDLTQEEKDMLSAQQWVFVALTPTVLRAVQAVAVGLGILRSFIF